MPSHMLVLQVDIASSTPCSKQDVIHKVLKRLSAVLTSHMPGSAALEKIKVEEVVLKDGVDSIEPKLVGHV